MKSFLHSRVTISEEDQQAAMHWWNSLQGGKKRYLKKECKLTNREAIFRYWIATQKNYAFTIPVEGVIK